MATDGAGPDGSGLSEGLDARSRSALAVDGPTVVSFSGGRTSAPKLTPEQRARLISGGPNAGRVRKAKEGK
jgi:hypothetical protein